MTTIVIKHTEVQADGNKLTGNTFAIKEYIKAYLGGKWDGVTKSWIIDVVKLNDLVARQAIVVRDPATSTIANANGSSAANGWCNHCHSYCWGDCQS